MKADVIVGAAHAFTRRGKRQRAYVLTVHNHIS